MGSASGVDQAAGCAHGCFDRGVQLGRLCFERSVGYARSAPVGHGIVLGGWHWHWGFACGMWNVEAML